MTQDEQYIYNKVGKENPFRVPEGYFETVRNRVMSQIPEEEKSKVVPLRHRTTTFRYWITAIAASVCVCLFSLGLLFHHRHTNRPEQQNIAVTPSQNTIVDEAMYYTMMDNDDIYAYCAGE